MRKLRSSSVSDSFSSFISRASSEYFQRWSGCSGERMSSLSSSYSRMMVSNRRKSERSLEDPSELTFWISRYFLSSLSWTSRYASMYSSADSSRSSSPRSRMSGADSSPGRASTSSLRAVTYRSMDSTRSSNLPLFSATLRSFSKLLSSPRGWNFSLLRAWKFLIALCLSSGLCMMPPKKSSVTKCSTK